MMDAGTAVYRSLMIRGMLERYKNRLVGSRERVEKNREVIGESLYLADARATADRLIQMYDNDIRQAEEAIGWLKDWKAILKEEMNVTKRKGNETGHGLRFTGVKCNKWR